MSFIITSLLELFAVLYFLILIAEWIANRSLKKIWLELFVLAGFMLMLNRSTGFPTPATRQAFGGVSQLSALAMMFLCTILGIMAHYFFNLRRKFSWKSFLKPLVISPMVFLPLTGSVQGVAEFETVQMITFAIIAFQNGFFWKEVFAKNVKKKA